MAWSDTGSVALALMHEYRLRPKDFSELDGQSYSFLLEGLKRHREEEKKAYRKARRRR